MLAISLSPGGEPAATQSMTSPAVYLDQWALMMFAESPGMGSRFSEVLLRREGTLLLSWTHLLEFIKIESPARMSAVEGFFQRLDANFAFIRMDPGAVIAEEDRLLNVPPDMWNGAPHLDQAVLPILVANSRCPGMFDVGSLFRLSQAPELMDLWRNFDDQLAGTTEILEKQRERFRDDPEFAARLEAPLRAPVIPTPTRYVFRRAIDNLIRDSRKVMKTNDWADLNHMIVSCSYADFVLLDKGWASRSQQIRRRVEKDGLLSRFANVYSAKCLADFWSAFDV
jgi:hypothetical protein